MPFLQKKFQDFFALYSFFLLYFLTAICKKIKKCALLSQSARKTICYFS